MNSSGRYDLRFSLWVALVASSGCSPWGSYGSSWLWEAAENLQLQRPFLSCQEKLAPLALGLSLSLSDTRAAGVPGGCSGRLRPFQL